MFSSSSLLLVLAFAVYILLAVGISLPAHYFSVHHTPLRVLVRILTSLIQGFFKTWEIRTGPVLIDVDDWEKDAEDKVYLSPDKWTQPSFRSKLPREM